MFPKLGRREGCCGVDDQIASFRDIGTSNFPQAMRATTADRSDGGDGIIKVSYKFVERDGGNGDWMTWPTYNEAVRRMSC